MPVQWETPNGNDSDGPNPTGSGCPRWPLRLHDPGPTRTLRLHVVVAMPECTAVCTAVSSMHDTPDTDMTQAALIIAASRAAGSDARTVTLALTVNVCHAHDSRVSPVLTGMIV